MRAASGRCASLVDSPELPLPMMPRSPAPTPAAKIALSCDVGRRRPRTRPARSLQPYDRRSAAVVSRAERCGERAPDGAPRLAPPDRASLGRCAHARGRPLGAVLAVVCAEGRDELRHLPAHSSSAVPTRTGHRWPAPESVHGEGRRSASSTPTPMAGRRLLLSLSGRAPATSPHVPAGRAAAPPRTRARSS